MLERWKGKKTVEAPHGETRSEVAELTEAMERASLLLSQITTVIGDLNKSLARAKALQPRQKGW